MRDRLAWLLLIGGAVVSFAAQRGWQLPAAVAAGTLALLTLHGTGRRVMSVVLALLGAGLFALGWSGPTWALLVGGPAIIVGGVLQYLHRPSSAARFERRGGTSGVDSDDPSRLWKALDEGRDPTTD